LSGLAVSLLVVQACGSDDGKKRAMQDGDAGMGGEAGSGEGPGAGGSIAGMPNTSGNAGEGVVSGGEGGTRTPTAGEGGMPSASEGGAGGVPAVPADPELLFTVESGALGLADTAISAQANPQNVIYTSNTGSQDWVSGTNTVKVIGVDLGLAATDSIVAFTELQPAPQNPIYAFSVTDGTEGNVPTTVAADASTLSESLTNNVYFSDAVQSYRYLGEAGDEYGYNGLLMHGASLGAAGLPDGGEGAPDNLRGLMFRDANEPISELYFTTNPAAQGATDGVVADTPQDERGCTVFKSALDGTASVAFSCADLGLAAFDQIDGLLVYGDGEASEVIFSVTPNSLGVAGSALAAAVASTDPLADPGAALFRSLGSGTNTAHLSPRELGLGYENDDQDNIDALAVMNGSAGSVVHTNTCTITYDPYDIDNGGGLLAIERVTNIGSSILLLAGSTGNDARILAYNANTCAFIAQQDLPGGFEDAPWAVVPVVGWTAAAPLANLEYLLTQYNPDAFQYEVHRFDAAGVFLTAATTNLEYAPVRLIHEPVNDLLYALTQPSISQAAVLELAVMPRPTALTTEISADAHTLSLPCSYNPRLAGTDQNGNLWLAQLQGNETDYRVCGYTPSGALLVLPYDWTPQTPNEHWGFLLGRAGHYSFTTNGNSGPFQIERGVFRP
jgi:hypothetical protein